MTISTTTSRVDALGNGSARTFSFAPVVVFEETDLQVTLLDTTGNETSVTLGAGASNFSVSVPVFPGSGSVTYPASGGSPLPTGWTIVMKRVVPILQNIQLENQGAYLAEVQEGGFDYLTAIDQQQQEQLDRSLQLAVTDAPGTLHLPTKLQRALNLMGFDADGNPIAAQPSSALVSTVMQPVVAAASLALARTALGVPVVSSAMAATVAAGSVAAGRVALGVFGAGAAYKSVFDFGAVGDGTTDDTAAIQAGIAATTASNVALLFPPGTYSVTNLTLPHNTEYDSYPIPLWQRMPRLIGIPGAVIKKRSGGSSQYLLAAARWATNVAFGMGPVWIENLVLDANHLADYAYVGTSYQATYINIDCRNANIHGCFETASTANGTPLGGSRSSSIYRRCSFHGNAAFGFLVDAYSPSLHIISDYWFEDNLIYDNGPNNAGFFQTSGWVIRGNHAFWFNIPPASGNWSVFLGDGVAMVEGGNVWEGYSTTHAGLEINGGVSGPVTINGDTFLLGLGVVTTFAAGDCKLIRVQNCRFIGNTFLQHSYSDATCELVSDNNVFDNAGAYSFSAGGAHAGVLRASNDRIGSDQKIYAGRQFNANYGVRNDDGVIYPAALPYQILNTDPRTIRLTAALSADKVIILPINPTRGQRYRVIRSSGATGAFVLHVQVSGGSDVYNLSAAQTYADYEHDGFQWIQTGSGVAA